MTINIQFTRVFQILLFLFIYFFINIKTSSIFKKPLLTYPHNLITLCIDNIKGSASANSTTANELLTQTPLNFDYSILTQAGVYQIYDINSDKMYFGETDNLFQRLNQHNRWLREKNHHNKGLRDSSQKNPITNFKFIILHAGPDCKNLESRVECQDFYIEKNKDRCYNIVTINTENKIIRPIMYKGERFESVREAARLLKTKGTPRSRTQLKRDLENPAVIDVFYLDNKVKPYGCISLFGKKNNSPSLLFTSYKECVAAGFATSTQNARRKIQRKENGWRYAHTNAEGKPLRIPYTLKPGEISYEQWKDTQD